MPKFPTVKQMKFRKYPPLKGGPLILWPTNRYFRRNEGTTDYAQFAAPITLASAFVMEFDLWSSNQATQIALSTLVGTDNWFAFFSDGKIEVKINGSGILSSAGVFSFTARNSIRIERDVSNSVNIYINDTLLSTGILSGDFSIDTLYRGENSAFDTEGILANLKIWDNGTLIRDYPLDEPKGTSVIYDTVGGNNGTIINGNDEDKGLFTEQANGDWLSFNEYWDAGDSISNGAEGSFTTVAASSVHLVIGANYRTTGVASGFVVGSQQTRYGSTSGSDVSTNGAFSEERICTNSTTLRTRVGNTQCNAGAALSGISTKEVLKVS